MPKEAAAPTGETTLSPVGDSASRPDIRPGRLHLMFAVSCLYASFGIMAALIQGGLPPVLRARGLDLQTLTWTFALYLPFGLAFLWAPIVDRYRLPLLSPRIGWIAAAQAVTVGGLVLVGLGENLPLLLLFGIGLVISISVATMDLALDALTVEMTDANLKPLAASTKLGALAFGSMVGGGVFAAMIGSIGWTPTFLVAALLVAVTVIPVLGLIRADRDVHERRPPPERHLFSMFRKRAMLVRLAAVLLTASVIFPLSALNRIMLVDLGVSLERIGWLVGTAQPLGLLLVSLCSAVLLRRLGNRVMLLLFAGLCLACLALMGGGYAQQMPEIAIVGAIGMTAGVGGIMVVIAALILVWAAGDEVATTYAVMFSGSRFVAVITTVATGQIVALLDWVTFYAFGAGAILIAVLFLAALVPAAVPPEAPASE